MFNGKTTGQIQELIDTFAGALINFKIACIDNPLLEELRLALKYRGLFQDRLITRGDLS